MADRPPAWNIELAANSVADTARGVMAQDLDIALLAARLSDQYRDAGIAPLTPAQLQEVTGPMDAAAWQRLALIIELLTEPQMRQVLPRVSQRLAVRRQLENLVHELRSLGHLEMRMLAASLVRAEELVRRAARALGVAIEGETAGESAARLDKIDYTRLLASVDTAKSAARAQLAELLQQQEAQDNRIARRRRGKW